MYHKDCGATEIVSFAIVLAVIIFCALLYMFIAVPIASENKELTHNDEILLEMADVKYGIDRLLVSEMDGVVRMATLSLSPKGDKDQVSVLPELTSMLSSGTITVEAGDPVPDLSDFSYLKITYTSKNSYAENQVIVYDGGKLIDNDDKVILREIRGDSGGFYAVVPTGMETMGMSGNEFAVLTYRVTQFVSVDHNKYGEFALTLRGFYNG